MGLLPAIVPLLFLVRHLASRRRLAPAITGVAIGGAVVAAAGIGIVFLPFAIIALILEIGEYRSRGLLVLALIVVGFVAVLGLVRSMPISVDAQVCTHRNGVTTCEKP